MRDAWAGIDVAISKTKRLPVCVVVREGGRLMPLPLRRSPPTPPRGRGNEKALDNSAVTEFAQEARVYLQDVEKSEGLSIRAIGIDAPRSFRCDDVPRRLAECAMDARRISCFATPSREDFERIRSLARAHLDGGGALSRLPHTNQLWMLAGFALFEALKEDYDCIEVFPQATIAALGCAAIHKSAPAGLAAQLDAVSRETGWPSTSPDDPDLTAIGYGSRHDKLDAYLSAWVASLPESQREACGEPPDDVIWIPRMGAGSVIADARP